MRYEYYNQLSAYVSDAYLFGKINKKSSWQIFYYKTLAKKYFDVLAKDLMSK